MKTNTIQQYQNAHKWMIIPWIIIIVGFTPQYFMTWLTEPWGYHLHAISAMIWYGLMVSQPYLATHRKLSQHRLWGIIGVFVAGAVVFSALSIVPTNVYFGAIGGFEPLFPAAFFYGIVLTESLQVLGFGMAVIIAVIKAKDPDQHAIWMLSTLFFGLMPGWARLVMFPLLMTGGEVAWLDMQTCINIGVIIFVLVVLYVGYRLEKLKHPAIILSVLCVILMAFSITIGGQSWYQELVTSIMKPTVPWNLDQVENL